MRVILLAAAVVLAAAPACSKKHDAPGAAPIRAANAPAGARRVAIEAGSGGFAPSTIDGKPGEALVLVFTRTVDGDCMAQVKFPGQKPVDLPRDTPVEVAVTVPQTGQLQFMCAMDMNTGVIVPKT